MRSVRQHFTDYMDSLQQAKLTASDGSTKDLFGGSVAVSGSTAVVGSPNKNTHTGAAYVFVRAGGTWSEQAELIASDGQSGDAFGGAVAISGSTVLVGAPDKNYYRGAVYVFIRSHGAWSQQAELFAPDAACCDEFGFSVAISGQSALVGAPFKNSYMGKAYVFVRSGGTWAPRAELHALNRATYDYFGYSVAISGFTAVVGSPGHAHSGAAFVFVHSGTWSPQAEIDASDGVPGDFFGSSSAIFRRTALVGASQKNSYTGAAYVFARSGETWAEKAELIPSDGIPGDFFGNSAAISGSSAVVGADAKDFQTGASYVFVGTASTWMQLAKLTSSDGARGDAFGSSVSIFANTALVGAPGNHSSTGAAYVFVIPSAPAVRTALAALAGDSP